MSGGLYHAAKSNRLVGLAPETIRLKERLNGKALKARLPILARRHFATRRRPYPDGITPPTMAQLPRFVLPSPRRRRDQPGSRLESDQSVLDQVFEPNRSRLVTLSAREPCDRIERAFDQLGVARRRWWCRSLPGRQWRSFYSCLMSLFLWIDFHFVNAPASEGVGLRADLFSGIVRAGVVRYGLKANTSGTISAAVAAEASTPIVWVL